MDQIKTFGYMQTIHDEIHVSEEDNLQFVKIMILFQAELQFNKTSNVYYVQIHKRKKV